MSLDFVPPVAVSRRACLLRAPVFAPPAGIAPRDLGLLTAHASGLICDQLWFFRTDPAVSIGCNQAADREARQPYCSEAGIPVLRRITGGGALYLDQGQQLFSLIVPGEILGPNLAARLERGASIIADALQSLGIATGFKAPNDLQTPNRQKIASVFLAQRGDSALLCGSIICELDLARAMQALLIPTEKLTVTGLEHARERMTSVCDELGRKVEEGELHTAIASAFGKTLGLAFHQQADLEDNIDLEAVLPDFPWENTADSIETKDKVEGATFRLLLSVDQRDTTTDVRFATDAHLFPDDSLATLAASLAGQPVKALPGLCRTWFSTHPVDTAGFDGADIVRLVGRAVSKQVMQKEFNLTNAQASGLMLAGSGNDPVRALQSASVMLVPYCAKPNWCKWRHTVDCVECGECEVGDAYEMARQRNMEVVTITNFEHLANTLERMKSAGVESYVGMCCGEFFLKRHHAFRDSGMDSVLLDIEGATCYELKEENLAYAGAFKAEARLDLDAVRKVMAHVPQQPAASKPCLNEGVRPALKFKARKDSQSCGSNCACRPAAAE